MINKKDLIRFIEDVQQEFNEFNVIEGCIYKRLTIGQEEDLYLVFAGHGCEEDGLICKIAYNTDDLQYDYDVDWYMPAIDEYSVVDTSQLNCDQLSAQELANRVLDDINYIINNIEKYKEI